MDLPQWIESLNERSEAFGGLPACPYAHKATVVTISCKDFEVACRLATWVTLPAYGVLLIEISQGAIPCLSTLNSSLQSSDLVALLSDSDNPVVIDGHRTTQRIGRFLILQGGAELHAAREALWRTPYYRKWSAKCLAQIGVQTDPFDEATLPAPPHTARGTGTAGDATA